MNASNTQLPPPDALPDWALDLDLDALTAELEALGAELRAECRAHAQADLAHLRRVAAVGRACTALGWATAGFGLNPVSVVLLSTGRVARWTMVGHHVGHNGYGRAGGPPGKDFAEGARRWVDWLDWLVPAAWKHEHNQLHHTRLNERRDPDLVEENLAWLRDKPWSPAVKLAVVAFFVASWRWTYYAPNTLAELHRAGDAPAPGSAAEQAMPQNVRSADPRTPQGRAYWLRSLLPYAAVNFVGLPALFAVASPGAAASAAANSLAAEVLANLHSFVLIVPNHAGDDLWRFSDPPADKGEFWLRQILGSANYRTGGEVNDFLHGYLNYQIEHHLWPDLPMAAYRRAQPRVQAVCARHGVPYVQEGVFRRVRKTLAVMTGRGSMRRWPPRG